MAKNEIHGTIVYVGPEGAGKTANLECLSRKLKKEHRGDLKVFQGEDGTYEHLPISLGSVRGRPTSIDIYTVPGSENHAETRSRLLEQVDGVMLVADLRPERHDATLASVEELQATLASRGQGFDDVCLVIQYNHTDAASENAVEQLHRRIGLTDAAVFEAVASEGKGVLQALTALSKQVLAAIRAREEQVPAPAPMPAEAADAIDVDPIDADAIDVDAIDVDAIDAPEPLDAAEIEAEPFESEELASAYEVTAVDADLDASLPDLEQDAPLALDPPEATQAAPGSSERELRLESAGEPTVSDDALLIPIALRDDASGEAIELSLRIELRRN